MGVEFVSKLKNLRTFPNAEASLSSEEIDVILAVLDFTFKKIGQPERGTFILEGGPSEYQTFKILDFEFKRGRKRNFGGQDRDSRLIAQCTVNDASSYSRNSQRSAIRDDLYNAPMILLAPTDNGRFVAACLMDNAEVYAMRTVYIALIKTLSALRPDDKTLEKCFQNTMFEEIGRDQWNRTFVQEIDEFLEKSGETSVKAWREIRDGIPEVFFEDLEPEEEEEDEE